VALVNLGDVLLGLNRAAEAIGFLQQAQRTFTEISYPDGIGYAQYWLGSCYAAQGRDPDAIELLRQALASHRESGNRHRQAVTLRLLGRTLGRCGLAGPAHESRALAAVIFDELGDLTQAAEVRAEDAAAALS